MKSPKDWQITIIDDIFDYVDGISHDYTPYSDPFDKADETDDPWTTDERKAFVSDLKMLHKLIPKALKYMKNKGK